MSVCIWWGNSRTGVRRENMLYPILINLQQYGLGPENLLNYLQRTPEKPKKLIFCH